MKRILFLAALLFVFLNSCKKTEYEQVKVENNSAPDDNSISPTIISNFVNKSYISLLGRKPDASEYNSGYSLVTQDNFSPIKRKEFLNTLLNKSEYRTRLYEIARADLLNNLDTTEITLFINVFTSYLNQPEYANVAEQLNYEIERLKALRDIPQKLANNTTSVEEMYKTSINNYFYDQINMGTENFVVSSFQHFFFRYPTEEELEKAKKMVDGFSSNLFYQNGKTKEDYLLIFFNNNNYFEGQVRQLYTRYLFREPDSEEQAYYSSLYKNNDFITLQLAILSSDEYVGID